MADNAISNGDTASYEELYRRLNKLNEDKNKALEAYEKTYKAYTREQYFRVITYANSSIEEFPEDTTLVPKFMYLRAISLGKVDVPDTLYASLNELLEIYPNSSVAPMAKAILNMLNKEYGFGVPITNEDGSSDSTMVIPDIYDLILSIQILFRPWLYWPVFIFYSFGSPW